MKFTLDNLKFIIAAVVVALGLGWYFLSGSQEEDPSLEPLSFTAPLETRFLELTSELSIRFDTTVFNNPRFTALTDLTTPLAPESVGHTDPFTFAPIPATAQ